MQTETTAPPGTYDDTIGANWRCIIGTAILACAYWFLPRRNKWVLLGILYFTYLAIAWYDYYFECSRTMRPTVLALFYWWAKPQDSKQIRAYKRWSPTMRHTVLLIDIAILTVLLVVVGPVFYRWNP